MEKEVELNKRARVGDDLRSIARQLLFRAPRLLHTSGTLPVRNLMALDPQSVPTQVRCVPTEVRSAPQSQMCRGRRSWMVQLYIRLLTGRFQVRILVAEPAELEFGRFRPTGCAASPGRTIRLFTGRFQGQILVAEPLNSKLVAFRPTGCSRRRVESSDFRGVAPSDKKQPGGLPEPVGLACKAVFRHQVGRGKLAASRA